jgi:hypothetical protein
MLKSARYMKKKAGSQFDLFNLRTSIGLFVFLCGVFLALLGFGTSSSVLAQNGPTRAQLTRALAQALAIQPPACVPGQEMFHDVPASSPFCPFIEELVRRGITGGCGGGNYCPNSPVTRAQMAAFLVKVLDSHDIGVNNVATGSGALFSNTTGEENTGDGFQALFRNTTGGSNTANGYQALFRNTTATGNTAVGQQALFSNTTGPANTAIGLAALVDNTIGYQNVANGAYALYANTTGYQNTADGGDALYSNTTGYYNTAIGYEALYFNTTGHNNIGLGYFGGGYLSTGSNNIHIGNGGAPEESNTIRIGVEGGQVRTFIAGISGTAITGTAVVVDGSGQLGVMPSVRRLKDEIKPMDEASEAILALRPVTFRYKKDIDPQRTPQFGLVAEEVAKINPDLVVRDDKGEIYTVRYEAVNAMLLNEFLKAHRQMEEQQKQIDALATQLKEQAALIQKVSDKAEANKPMPQMVLNNE